MDLKNELLNVINTNIYCKRINKNNIEIQLPFYLDNVYSIFIFYNTSLNILYNNLYNIFNLKNHNNREKYLSKDLENEMNIFGIDFTITLDYHIKDDIPIVRQILEYSLLLQRYYNSYYYKGGVYEIDK